MDNDLERSVRFLEDALQTPTRGLLKLPLKPHSKDPKKDFSFSFSETQYENLLIQSYDTAEILMDDTTITGTVISGPPWQNTINNLYMEFGDIMQGCSGGLQILEVVEDFGRCCSDALSVVKSLKSQVAMNEIPEERWLENERNNWRLLCILYKDRLNQVTTETIDVENSLSEQNCIQSLFQKEPLIRECQLVVDWLERNALDRDDPILHFSDWSYGWEHTLHQLVTPETIAIGSTLDLINSMHPDAPHSQGLFLHHLDNSDDKKLCERIFMEIRCGNLEGAQELCYQNGHHWRAAMLEGWKLYHNPCAELTIDQINLDEKNVQEIEGNSNRDLWKLNALEFCKQTDLNLHEKASLGSLCGCLESILPVCNSWEDYLWAYMRTMIDIRVESEIRDNIMKNFEPLPEEYWSQKMSLGNIFQILDNTHNFEILEDARKIEHIIQKLIILDEIPTLVQNLEQWCEESTTPTHCFRFFAHLALFFDSIGQMNHKSAEKIIESYINRLSDMNSTQLVALYVSKVGKRKQIVLYAKHCEKLENQEERQLALNFAEEFSLDVHATTVRIVENIINKPNEMDTYTNLQPQITDLDQIKISSLDWLLFYEEQKIDVLKQTNVLIFKFLTLEKLEAAQMALNKISHDIIDGIRKKGELSETIEQIIKTFLSYKAYLDAQEAFNCWFKQFRNKPLPPAPLSETAQFTEKVAHKHKVSQYQAETERWKLTTTHSADVTKTLLYNVLLFPEGWLVGTEDATFLRSKCIPEVVLLLYSVLTESNLHEEAVQLADLIASQRYGLFKVFSKQKLEEILEKICESSVSLLKAKKDSFGNSNSV